MDMDIVFSKINDAVSSKLIEAEEKYAAKAEKRKLAGKGASEEDKLEFNVKKVLTQMDDAAKEHKKKSKKKP